MQIERLIQTFKTEWPYEINGRDLKIYDELDADNCNQIFQMVQEFREFIQGRNVIIDIMHDNGSFSYRVFWENNGSLLIRTESDNGAEAERLFDGEPPQQAINRLREETISNYNDFTTTLVDLLSTNEVSVEFEYTISADDLDAWLENHLEFPCRISYYHSLDDLKEDFSDIEFSELRDLLYTETGNRIFVVSGIDDYAYGSEVAIVPPNAIENNIMEEFIKNQPIANEQISKIRRECAIDYFEETYVPPNYLQFDQPSESSLKDEINSILASYCIISCILGTSNIARSTEEGWEIRITGRRMIESEIFLENTNDGVVLNESNSDTNTIETNSKTVNTYTNLFNWIYKNRVTDRLSLYRNISTLYATTVSGVVEEIEDISEGVRSNFQYYIQESVEEFVGVQQDVSEYVFKTHQEMSEIRRGLAQNLSRDLFRVFIFAAISWAAILTQLVEVARVRAALAVSLVPVVIYLGLGLRTTYGLDQQYQSIENSRQNHYEIYEGRISKDVLKTIKEADGSDKMGRQFKIDLCLYYLLFGLLFVVSVFTIIDLAVLDWVVMDLIEPLLENR